VNRQREAVVGLKITYRCPITKKLTTVGAFKHVSWYSDAYERGIYGSNTMKYPITVTDCPECKGEHVEIPCLKRESFDDPEETY